MIWLIGATFIGGYMFGWLHYMGYTSEIEWSRTKESLRRGSFKPDVPTEILSASPPKPLPRRENSESFIPDVVRLQAKRDYLDNFLKTHGSILSQIDLIHFIEGWESL